jgi:hypothetical protein
MITIIGPTASGKTALATTLAYTLGSEIISADSRQVYRGMTIGTGKDLGEYTVNEKKIPYHLIDICDAGEKYNLFEYQRDFIKTYNLITKRHIEPILCGGTGLYIEAVLKGYQLADVPQNPTLRKELEGKSLKELTLILTQLKEKNLSNMHNNTDVDSCKRAIRAIEIETYNLEHTIEKRKPAPIKSLIIGVDIDREERRKKITLRLKQRLQQGMIEEVEGLLNKGINPEDLIYYGLEYKYITEYIIGKRNYDDMFKHLEIAIHQFAKRQMTWFRGMERRGFEIHWIKASWQRKKQIETILKLKESSI